MNRVDVRECVADVVVAFDTGAHLAEVLMGKSSRKRRRKERDIEAAVEQRLLHNALVDSAAQCRRWSWERRQQYGDAFDMGDALAKAQLRAVLASVQNEVIQVVQAVTTRKHGAPSLLNAHEAAISSRQDALRAMDELCRRIAYGTAQTGDNHDTALAGYVQALSRASTVLSQVSHLSTSDVDTNVSCNEFYGKVSCLPSQELYVEGGQPFELKRQFSFHDASAVNTIYRHPRIHAGNSPSNYEPLDPVAELPDCEDISSLHDSLRSMSMSRGASSYGTASLDTTSSWSQTYSVPGQPFQFTSSETRALDAPEVVTTGYEPMLSPTHDDFASDQLVPTHSLEHDIFAPEPENVWSPLPRPARINGYHGFCKGAWQTRRNVREGLAIRVVEDEHGGGQVPFWSCKECEFRSRSKRTEASSLTEQIHHHTKSGTRFRWLFLAKSHVATTRNSDRPENYAYGCIFCAAEGRPSTAYSKLDTLMSHIISKHKPALMTVETKSKTKCVVGRVADRTEDWDVNLPVTRKSSVGGFVASAVTGRAGIIVEEPG